MTKYRGWLVLLAVILLCAACAMSVMQVTAEYPAMGEQVTYPVNEIDGIILSIEDPSFSPFKGYTLRYNISADCGEVYYFRETTDGGFEYLECMANGQWYRLERERTADVAAGLELALGGDASTGLSGSLVQKYALYGTRLKTGTYRLVLEMQDSKDAFHYLAAEFLVD